MTELELRTALHKIIILATGRGGSIDEIDLMLSLRGDGDWAPLIKVVDFYMRKSAASMGTVQAVETAVNFAFGTKGSTENAEIIAFNIDSGALTWSDYIIDCIFREDDSGEVLNNRATIAYEFSEALRSEGKEELFAGSAVVEAARNLIQSVTQSALTITNAVASAESLIKSLSIDGITTKVSQISSGKIYLDSNNDGILTEEEFLTNSDEKGIFVIPRDAGIGPIVVSGGTDLFTDKAFAGTLSAPIGSAVINPLTTILQALISSGNSIPEAKALLASTLDIPTNIDIQRFDPISVSSNETSSQIEKIAALDLASKSLQFQIFFPNGVNRYYLQTRP
jgi:hypothetical protein